VTPSRSPIPAPARGDLLDLTIDKVVFGGDGLARTPHGFIVFVPFSAAGETLRVRVIERKAHHARAEIVEVLTPSMERVAAPCPYYGRCGGCQYQHLDYREECRIKEQQVYEALVRGGKIAEPTVLPLIPSPADYAYRNRNCGRVSLPTVTIPCAIRPCRRAVFSRRTMRCATSCVIWLPRHCPHGVRRCWRVIAAADFSLRRSRPASTG